MNITEGWKLVPIEPTDEMLWAASVNLGKREGYAAMLAAAPTPPDQEYSCPCGKGDEPCPDENGRPLCDDTPPVQEVQWRDAERVSDIPEVHEALMDFAEDHTGDNGTYIVRAVMKAIKTPAQEAEPVGYLCVHPTQSDRLVKHKKSAIKYAEMYLDGVVQIRPVYTHAPFDKLRQAAEVVKSCIEPDSLESEHIRWRFCEEMIIQAFRELRAALEGKS